MGGKQLRPSQFVTTYGPGSLIPLSSGHVVLPNLTRMVQDLKKFPSFNKPNDNGISGLDKFEINDQKMIRILKNIVGDEELQIKIFRLPTNADLQKPDGDILFHADPFPRWSVCYAHSDTPILAKLEQSTTKGPVIRCPFCERGGNDPRRGTSVRFIQACQRGHIDDIDWIREVHHGTQCKGNVFLWQETGSSSNFTVSCHGYYEHDGFHKTACGSSTDYFTLKRSSENNLLECKGIWQERGVQEEGCNRNGKILLKNASNLRVSEVLSSVYIPKYPGQLYSSLFNYRQGIDSFYQRGFTKEEFVKFLRGKKPRWKIPLDTIKDVEEASLEDIVEVISNLVGEMDVEEKDEAGIDYETANTEEFRSLLKASIEGYPPQKRGEPTGLHMEPTDNTTFYSPDFELQFKVAPIRELFVTRAQLGYSREVVSRQDLDDLQVLMRRTGDLVTVFHDEGERGSVTRWFLGNQLVGEGLFIQAVDQEDNAKNQDPLEKKQHSAFKTWRELFASLHPDELVARRKTNPRFVWWHSLAHKIINELAIESGFSSNSIGERIYCVWNETRKRFESGILLFTAQTGGDGTLGGLTSLAKQFDKLLKNVVIETRRCSNDPICSARTRTRFRLNGAACHACLLISETSCELQNKFLDRNLLLETLKDG